MTEITLSRPMSKERLVELGDAAADLHLKEGLEMNSAVARAVAGVQLTTEQLQRVIEFSNHAVVARHYEKLEHGYAAPHIEGGPANPDAVRQLVQTTRSSPATKREVTLEEEYGSKFASGDFRIETPAETPHERYKRACAEVVSLRDKLASALQDALQDVEAHNVNAHETLGEALDRAKEAMLEGATPGEVFAAWTTQSPKLAGLIAKAARLEPEKTASHRIFDPRSDVVRSFGKFASAIEAGAAARQKVAELQAGVGALDEAAKEAGFGESLVPLIRAGKGAVKGVLEHAGNVGEAAGNVVRLDPEVARTLGQGAALMTGVAGVEALRNRIRNGYTSAQMAMGQPGYGYGGY